MVNIISDAVIPKNYKETDKISGIFSIELEFKRDYKFLITFSNDYDGADHKSGET